MRTFIALNYDMDIFVQSAEQGLKHLISANQLFHKKLVKVTAGKGHVRKNV